jgi:two-component system sensor histidine kinase SenX3
VVASQSQGLVEIAVTDTGIGIPEDEIGQVFDRFTRSSRSQLRETQGTGLGLTITKAIIERHGGTVSISSRDHAGTTVTVCLLVTVKAQQVSCSPRRTQDDH